MKEVEDKEICDLQDKTTTKEEWEEAGYEIEKDKNKHD